MKLIRLGLLGLLVCAADAQAAGFALYEHSASALGTAFAGQAVVAQDASTIFANAAGLTEVKGTQAVVNATVISSSATFTNSSGVQQGGDAGGIVLVPSMYLATDISHNVKAGIGVFGPYGLKSEWQAGWAGSSQGILSDAKTVNVNPTVAWKMTDKLSVGVGIDYQYLKATLSSGELGYIASLEGHDAAWGYNVGLLYQATPATRIGLSYRSAVRHHVTGTLTANAYPLPVSLFPLVLITHPSDVYAGSSPKASMF